MKMSTTAIVILGLAFSGIPAAAYSQSGDPCDRKTQKHKLDLIADEDTKTITTVVKGDKDANELHVCRGDTIEWRLKGDRELAFYLGYFEDDPVMELDKVSKGGKVTTTVRNDAPRGKAVSYHVRLINGRAVEPVIVVD